MGWTDIAWLVFVGWAVAAGVWVALSRPTGRRILRYARRYLRARPQASAGDLREALRQRFLGGSPPVGPAPSPLAQGVRDRWFPPDRDAIARRIEAAVQLVFPSGAGEESRAEPQRAPDRGGA
jgi:hypothetical protein